jgi:serine/threonine-protein kinase
MDPTTLPLPRTLDRYELLSVLGSGAFATVFRGRHVHTEQPVAVKVLQRHAAGPSFGTSGVERWLAEARAMAAVSHPNVVRVLDCGRADSGEVFLVMELAEGTTLDAMLRGRTLPIAQAVHLAGQMLDGLEAAHQKGIVHRDVKPPNVLVTQDGSGAPFAKLLDFGVSKNAMPGRGSGTLPGTAMGTPGYMAPELFGDAAAADGRADVYAVAATLFEMLSGRLPVDAPSYEEFVVRVRTERPPPLASVAPHVPPTLAAVVDRGLAPDRDARWPSARAFADALRASVSSAGVMTTGGPPSPAFDATMDVRLADPRLPAPPLVPRPPNAVPAVTDPPPGHSTLKSNPPPVARTTLRSSESKSRFGLIFGIVAALLLVAAGSAAAILWVRGGSGSASEGAVAHAGHEKKDGTMETREAERITAPPPLPFDPAGASSAADDHVNQQAGGSAAPARGITYTPVPSVTNHVTDASLRTFARAVTPRAQLCRPIGSAVSVLVELLVNDGEIGIAHIAPGNKGDKIVAQCVATAFKEVSDKGGRLSGEGIVQVVVALDPR